MSDAGWQPFGLLGRAARWALAFRRATIVHAVLPEARRDIALLRETRQQAPLLVPDVAALELLAHARAARRLGHAMAEAGVFGGGTARLLCEVKGDTPLHLFDVFDTLRDRSPSDWGAGAEVEAAFRDIHVPLANVLRLLQPYQHVQVHPGLFADTAQQVASLRFCFVHLDFDFESSTREALAFFMPRLCRAGVLIGDDYNLPGVRAAFDDFFAGGNDAVVPLPWGQVVVVKTS